MSSRPPKKKHKRAKASRMAGKVSVGKTSTDITATYSCTASEQSPVSSQEILNFWFGKEGEDSEELYRRKWFAADNSAQQRELDQEITSRFMGVYEEAKSLVGSGQHSSAHPTASHTWLWEGKGSERIRNRLAALIVLDQFPRHIHRYHPHRARILAESDAKALCLAEEIKERKWIEELPIPQAVFALMPFRHSPSVPRLQFVLESIERLDQGPPRWPQRCQRLRCRELLARKSEHTQDSQGSAVTPGSAVARACSPSYRFCSSCGLAQSKLYSSLLAKFKKATLLRYQRLCDRAQAGPEILEHVAFDVRGNKEKMASIRKEKLFKTMEKFITENEEYCLKKRTEKELSAGQQSIGKESKACIAVSLSGGVDSMVVAHLLVCLSIDMDFKVIAAHLDYGNREESKLEAAFLAEWCEDYGITLKTRTITEMHRASSKRGEYERMTRDIRFNHYGQVLTEFGCGGIMNGHHRGDVEENVISNVMKGSSLLYLAGMKHSSVVNHIRMMRPLLDHQKFEIYEYAHKYGVPYFKDTTPSWSTRGKLRNDLVPLLKEMYGDGVLAKLHGAGEESTQLSVLVQQSVFQPFYERVRTSCMGVGVDIGPYTKYPFFFWKEAMRHILHAVGFSQIKDRALRALLSKIDQMEREKDSLPRRHNRYNGYWIPLKQSNGAFLSNNMLFFLCPEAKPKKPHFVPGTPVRVNQSYQFGCWNVSLVLLGSPPRHPTSQKLSSSSHGSFSQLIVTDGKVRSISQSVGPEFLPLSSAKGSRVGTSEQELGGLASLPIMAAEPLPATGELEPPLLQTSDVLTGEFSYDLKVPRGEYTLVVNALGKQTILRRVDQELRHSIPMVQVVGPSSSSSSSSTLASEPPLAASKADMHVRVVYRFVSPSSFPPSPRRFKHIEPGNPQWR